ncbi:MAG TPA: tetratricopeptide repeat protein, partial [Pyrinomonadaceae bacterium]|nr:tetratricopeptide repeat protein [Pyrinomonadaceae bacterium]
AKGDALTRLGKNDEALKMYTRARSLGYAPPDGQAQIARALMRKERWAEALKELQPLAAVRPSAEVFLLIGECYQGLKQNVSALEAFRQAVKLDNRSAAAYFRQGQVMYDEREYQAAAESLERALALDQAGNGFDRARARKMANEALRKAGGGHKKPAEGASATSLLPQ